MMTEPKIIGDGADMPRIESLSAFLAVDKDGDKGVCAFFSDGQWFPMVGANEERIEALRPMAKKLAKARKQKIVLVRFSQREDREVIEP